MEENQPTPRDLGGGTQPVPGRPTNPKPTGPNSTSAAKPRRRRRWPWVVGAVIVFLLVLLLILPTLLCSGIGRSIIVSQVNQRINGKVEIKDLSLGWVSPIRLGGMVIYDASGRQILQLQHVATGLTLLNAARGNYALGKTQIDGLDVLVSREADGSLNWAHLARGAAPGSAEPAPAGKPAAKESGKLPNVEGEVVLDHCTVTYEDRSDPHQPPVYLRSVRADVKIPGINGTISDDVSIDAQVGSAAPGKIALAGSLDVVKDNRLAMDSATIDQELTIGNVDAAAIASFLGPKLKLAGNADASVMLHLTDGKNGTVEADLKVAKFAAGGGALGGAHLTSETFTLALPKTAITAPQGISNLDAARVQIGDAKAGGLNVQLKNASVVQGEGATARKVIDNDTFTVLAAGTYSARAAGEGVKSGLLKIGDEQGIFSVQKDPGQDAVVLTVPSLAKVMALDEAFSGKPAGRHYDGALKLSEEVSVDASGNYLAKGTGDLTNLSADGQADPEKAFHLAHDVALDPHAKALDLRSVNLVATITNALNLTLKGKILDVGGQQKINDALTADLAYDLDPLWKVLLPLMTPEQRKSYADVKVAGKYQKQFVVTGAYPAGEAFNKAVQSIAASGSLQFDQFYTSGVTLEKADVPVDLAGGVARVQYHRKPAGQNLPTPIVCNSGSLNLGGAALDLRTEHMLLTTPKELKVMENVSLNPVFASTFLGKYLNNPLFVNAAEAAGMLSMTIHNCDALAIDDLGSALGDATLEISIGTLQLGNPDLAKVLPQGFLSSLRGQVPAYHIMIAKGTLTQDFTLELLQEKRPLKLTGQVDLKSKQMVATTLELPWTLFALKDPNLQKYLPEGIKIPFVGRSDSPVPGLDVNQLMQQSLGQAGQMYLQDQLLGGSKNNPNAGQGGNAGQDAVKTLQGLLNKNKQQNNPPASQPSQPPPQQQPDPLKGLGDLFKKKK